MYARLRGIPEHNIFEAVETEIRRLDLLKYADKRCGSYRYTCIYIYIYISFKIKCSYNSVFTHLLIFAKC